MKELKKRHRGKHNRRESVIECGCFEQFSIGTNDEGKTYDVFEWLSDEQTQIICTTVSEDYAAFIAGALNTCKHFSPCREVE